MKVTPNLQAHFDSNRGYPEGRLDYLISLGIEPQFARQCEAMFRLIKADVSEVMAVSPVIIKENDRLASEFSKNNLSASIQVGIATREAANDRTYRSHKKTA